MKKLIVIALVIAGLLPATAQATSDSAQTKIVSGGHAMLGSEIARLQGATFYQSVEGQKYALANGIAVTSNTLTLHCWGAVKWKKGENIFGITLWGEWNHTSWCGYGAGTHIKRGSVNGYTDTWTGPVWESRNRAWRKWKCPLHPLTCRYTEASAEFAEGAGGYDVSGETVRIRMSIYASGVWR